MYLIRFKKSAEKEIEKLPASVVKRIVPVINDLALNPRPKGAKKLESKEEIWRIRIGDYRVL
jgi:mRNA interferase RelE/StbE